MKIMNRREFLKNTGLVLAGLTAGANLIDLTGCATIMPGKALENKVNQIMSETASFPASYSKEVNRILSKISKVYGDNFAYELKQLPELKSDYTSEKIKALEDIYSVGQEIKDKNLINAKNSINDIIKFGKDTPKTHLISVPLREWFLMHKNGRWGANDAFNILNEYNKKFPLHSFLKTDWKYLDNDDWKKWEEKGNEYVVLFKKNRDFLIQYNQAARLSYIPDKADYAQNPKETRKKGGGDCEDFAIEAAYDLEVLEKAGLYENVLVYAIREYIGNNYKGHVILSYKNKGNKEIYVMDNARRTGIRKYNSIKEASRQIGIEGGYDPKRIKIKGGLNWRTFRSNHLARIL